MKYWKWAGIFCVVLIVIALLGSVTGWAGDASKAGNSDVNPFEQFVPAPSFDGAVWLGDSDQENFASKVFEKYIASELFGLLLGVCRT